MSLYDKASIALIPSGTNTSTLYSVLPANGDGDFTHSRGSTATRVNKDGFIESVATNVPRLDYPLIDGEVQDCPHLLLEPSRTNQFTYSESLNSGWSVGGVVMTLTASQFISPDGSQNASRLEIPSTGSPSVFAQIESHSSGTQYTISVYAKSNTGTNQSFRLYGDYGASGNISSDFTATNEWQRFSYTFTASASGSRGAGIYNTTNQSADLQVYGIQFEQGSYPSSYIPTSGSSITRSADLCNNAGTSAQVNNDAGAFFVEIQALEEGSSASRRITLSDESSSDRIMIETDESTGTFKFFIAGGGTVRTIATSTGNTQTDINKLAIGYDGVNAKAYINGTQVGSITNATTRTGIDTVDIADWNGTSNVYFGRVKQVIVFNEALTDSELATLTS